MNSYLSKRARFSMAVAAGLASLPAYGLAATYTYQAGGTGNWSDPAGWTPAGGPPTVLDTATFALTSPASITIDNSSATAGKIGQAAGATNAINLNNQTFTLGGAAATTIAGSMSWTGPGTVAASANTLGIGASGAAAQLALDGATVNVTGSNLVSIGQSGDSTGSGELLIKNGGAMTVNSSATFRLGWNALGKLTITRGSLDTQVVGGTSVSLGDYRGPGVVLLDGANSSWTNAANFQTARGYNGANAPAGTTAAATITVQNGAKFLQSAGTFTLSKSGSSTKGNTWVTVDGSGSTFQVSSTTVQLGGYSSEVRFDVTNGGLLKFDAALGTGFNYQSAATATSIYNVSGANSKIIAPSVAISGRFATDGTPRQPVIMTIGAGATVEATMPNDGSGNPGFTGTGVAVVDRGRLSLQGGTVALASGVNLAVRNNSTSVADQAVLEGFGTITGGGITAATNTLVSPGINGAGKFSIINGSLTTSAATTGTTPQPATSLNLELSTAAGNSFDQIELVTAGQSATIPAAITYSMLSGGSLSNGAGVLDFIVADSINYQNATLGDIPAGADNLDSLLAGAGYTRVLGSDPIGAGQYRYAIVADALMDSAGAPVLDALRLEFQPIPEPASLGLLALGGLLMLRRRRA